MIGAYAMASPQIDDKDPLCFFVTNNREIIINPTITRHSNYFTDSKESCMTFIGVDRIIVPRWQKMDVSYLTIMLDPEDNTKYKLSSIIEESVTGKKSFIWQHEIQHLQGGKEQYIYEF
jgi:peptide deformylase